ncbi:unnamed protein product [Hyaloperonospora brassicae]|uniref:Transmembrane protein n=1 Tax=Hyaloperonospora brassicae TaxID=162125 RepID=A0AAV0V0S0_HYABA|nr:unnamed protein product [Hyaloperonospora brassicae]
MATRHDSRHRRRPVCNAILKWQLQQEEQRVAEAHYRLTRMSAPSPSSSLRIVPSSSSSNSSFDRRVGARRPRVEAPYCHDTDAVDTTLCMAPHEHKRVTNGQKDGLVGSERPSQSLVRDSNEVLTSDNATREFYAIREDRQGRPRDGRTDGKLLRVEVPAAKRSVGRRSAGVSLKRSPDVDGETSLSDGRRTNAMLLHCDTVDASVLGKWSREDDSREGIASGMKTAKSRDKETMWKGSKYGAKDAQAHVDQLSAPPPVTYSPSNSFLDMFASRRSAVHGDAALYFENGGHRFQSLLDVAMGDNMMAPSELSTDSIGKRTMSFAEQHHEGISLAAATNGPAASVPGQSVADILASLEDTSTGIEALDANVDAGNGYDSDGSTGRNQLQLFCGDFCSSWVRCAQVKASSGVEVSRWALIVVACCFAIGTCGFFMEELMVVLMALYSKRIHFSLSKADQKRMRGRVDALQQKLQAFQLSVATIDMKSQKALTDLRRLIAKMRQDRERHQHMLANEMQGFRHHVSDATYELVEQERELIQARLAEVAEMQRSDDKAVDSENTIVGSASVDADQILEEDITGKPVQVLATGGSSYEAIQSSFVGTDVIINTQFCSELTKAVPSHKLVTRNEVDVSLAEASSPDYEQAHAGQRDVGSELELVGGLPKVVSEESANVHDIELDNKLFTQIEEVDIKRVHEIESAAPPASDQDVIKVDGVVAVVPNHIEPSRYAWNIILVLVGITLLSACFVLRAYNINRRKRWLAQRRKRRNQRAVRLARQRARAMAARQDDSDEWDSSGADGVEEVSLMTHVQGIEDDESGASASES